MYLTNPYYLFKITSHSDKNSILFYADNISDHKCRYDEFIVIETGSTYVSLSAATVHLSTTGWYDYEVYQTASMNFEIGPATNLLESGLLFVSASTASITYNTYTGTSSYIFYNSNN